MGRAGADGRERPIEGDQARRALGTAVAGQDPQVHLVLTEPRVLASDPNVAGHRELATAAEGEAVDASDDGFAQAFDAAEDALASAGEGFAGFGIGCGEFSNISAGGEGLLACAGEEDDADIFV